MNRRIPVGHIDGHDLPQFDSMSKTLAQALEDLQEDLKKFLTQHPKWWYGTTSWFSEESRIIVWHIGKAWSGKFQGEYTPPSLDISFWKVGPTPIFKGKKLKAKELDIPASFMAQFLTEHPHLGCKSETFEPWAITYRVFSKASKRRKKKTRITA